MTTCKCERCGGEKPVIRIIMPREAEDRINLGQPVDLCQDCVNEFVKAVIAWWDELPI